MSREPPAGTDDGSVVVPAISAPSSLAVCRSLARRGVGTIAVSEREAVPAFRSRFCDESVRVPSPHDDLLAYKEALRSLAERADVATIVPVREEDVYVLARYREEFREHVHAPWPTLETLAMAQDRVRLFDAAAEVGVGAPETRLLDAGADWEREWIVKPRFSVLADEYADDYGPETCTAPPSTRYLPSDEAPDVASFESEMGHVPLLQEYVPTTDEYGFFALYDRGEAVATFQHRQIRGWSYTGGPSAFRKSIRDPALEEAGRSLLDHLEWHGLAMVEFLRDEAAGEYKLMEVNPRFWSSLPFSVRAGADFPYYYWLLARGERERIDDDYEADLGGHLLRGELSYLYSILAADSDLVDRPSFPGAIGAVARSLGKHPRFDYLRSDDLRPFVRDAMNTAAATGNKLK